jgi:hypothetical protein
MSRLSTTLLSLLCLSAMSDAVSAAPKLCGARTTSMPTKTIRIYNNSTTTPLYVFMQSPQRNAPDYGDLWMRSACGVQD